MREKKRSRREFTPQFRKEAVKLMNERLDDGMSLAQIGRDLGVEPDLLRKWARDLGEWSADGSRSGLDPAKMNETQRENEIRRLRRELETTRQERDFLKKATAFFVKESQ
jgi:transposase